MDEQVKKIAEEVAFRLITVERYHDTDSYYVTFGAGRTGDGIFDSTLGNNGPIVDVAARARIRLMGEIEQAIERALLACPVPSPISEETLESFKLDVEEMEKWVKMDSEFEDYSNDQLNEEIAKRDAVAKAKTARKVLGHVEFLTRLLQDLSADGAVAQYRAGWNAAIEQMADENLRDRPLKQRDWP